MTTSAATGGAGSSGSPYRVPRRETGWRSFALAIGMHALLFVFLWGGINWQNSEPVAVEAEVWDLTTQQAAPPPPPVPESKPEPKPEPEPTPAPPPPPPPKVAPPEKVAPPKVDPEIALKKEREKKKEEKRLAEEEAKKKQKLEDERKEKLAEQKKLDEKKKREEEDKERKLAEEKEEQKKKDEDKKKLAAQKKAAAESQAKLEKQRAEDMRRILGAAAGSTGTAEKSTAPRMDSGYRAAIAAKIKGNISYAGSQDLPGNPSAEFQITQLPTGEIISVRRTKSSGIPAYDTAVENAISKSSPLPKKKDGTVEREITAAFKLKDLP